MKLIGVHGKARSGKDTIYEVMHNTYGFNRLAFADRVKELVINYFDYDKDKVATQKGREIRRTLQGVGMAVRNHGNNIYQLLRVEQSALCGDTGFPIWVEEIAAKEFDIGPAEMKLKRAYTKRVLSGVHNMFVRNIDHFMQISGGDTKNYWVNYLLERLDGYPDKNIHVVTDVRFENELDAIKQRNGKIIKVYRNIDYVSKIGYGRHHVSETALDDVTNWDFVIENSHKPRWRTQLNRACGNCIRKFLEEGFFTQEEIDQFKIRIEDEQ